MSLITLIMGVLPLCSGAWVGDSPSRVQSMQKEQTHNERYEQRLTWVHPAVTPL